MSEEEARAQLESSKKLYYRIGEVSRLTGVKAHVLRYWETEFRWMAPPKSRSRQRLYRKRDIEFVLLLKQLLWDERYTIAGARQRIQDLGVEEALAQAGGQAPSARTTPGDPTDSIASPDGTAPALSESQWAGVQSAFAEMRSELNSLRGTLQDGV